ncbi:MAG: hypothetical protein CM1200mP32_00470 [Methanobacteriota archaeon]|nr:MAG: hypothetical protein CM1200mP32_00470 [Euryarchaeota archaeon]
MATVIVALGGSLLRPEVEHRHSWLEGLIEVVRDRVTMDDRLGFGGRRRSRRARGDSPR